MPGERSSIRVLGGKQGLSSDTATRMGLRASAHPGSRKTLSFKTRPAPLSVLSGACAKGLGQALSAYPVGTLWRSAGVASKPLDAM